MSRILSFSLWGGESLYNEGAVANARAAASVYPDWQCRFYCDPESPACDTLRDLGCQLIPMTPLGWHGLFWRFLAAADGAAEFVLFRDTDSLVSQREAAAVAEWMDSGRALHTMHDHDQHVTVPMLGGLWGVRGGQLLDIAAQIKHWLSGQVPSGLGPDQEFLREVIWPRFRHDHLGHVQEKLLRKVLSVAGVASYRSFPTPLPEPVAFVGARELDKRQRSVVAPQSDVPPSIEHGEPSDVWYVFPSCNPTRAVKACAAWRERGYRTAVLLDYGLPTVGAEIELYESPYQGYYRSANRLCRMALARGAQIVVAGGDDMLPDPIYSAAEIAAEFRRKFADGYGVMQPIGDDLDGTDRICGSPWLGREFILSSYGGRGPYWPEYGHFFGDQELFQVARTQGVLWQRQDLTHRHEHWLREGAPAQTDYQLRNGNEHWHRDEALYDERSASDFPGHEPNRALGRAASVT